MEHPMQYLKTVRSTVQFTHLPTDPEENIVHEEEGGRGSTVIRPALGKQG